MYAIRSYYVYARFLAGSSLNVSDAAGAEGLLDLEPSAAELRSGSRGLHAYPELIKEIGKLEKGQRFRNSGRGICTHGPDGGQGLHEGGRGSHKRNNFV